MPPTEEEAVSDPEAATASSSSDGEAYTTPGRAAERYIVSCPLCKKRVTLRCLRYRHKCKPGPSEHARRRQQEANAAVVARMTVSKGVPKAAAQIVPKAAAQIVPKAVPESKASKYANLLRF